MAGHWWGALLVAVAQCVTRCCNVVWVTSAQRALLPALIHATADPLGLPRLQQQQQQQQLLAIGTWPQEQFRSWISRSRRQNSCPT